MEMKDLIRQLLNEQFANVRAGAGESNITQEVKDILKSMGATTVEDKFKALANPKSDTLKTQEGFAAMMLLQYLSDIKNNFNASSAGFIFEDFIAGILDGSKPDGNPAVDVWDAKKDGYQVKLYNDGKSSIKLSSQYDPGNDAQNVKYFIVGVKKGDSIVVYLKTLEEYYQKANVSRSIRIRRYDVGEKEGKISKEIPRKEEIIKDIGHYPPISGERGKGLFGGDYKYEVIEKDSGIKVSDFEKEIGTLNLDVKGQISSIGEDIYKNIVSMGDDLRLLENKVKQIILNVDDETNLNKFVGEAKNLTDCVTDKIVDFKKGIVNKDTCKVDYKKKNS